MQADACVGPWQQEVSLKSDALQILFRRRVKALEYKGWQIDKDRLNREFTGRKACAVPSPARQIVSSWAIETIPTVEVEERGPEPERV